MPIHEKGPLQQSQHRLGTTAPPASLVAPGFVILIFLNPVRIHRATDGKWSPRDEARYVGVRTLVRFLDFAAAILENLTDLTLTVRTKPFHDRGPPSGIPPDDARGVASANPALPPADQISGSCCVIGHGHHPLSHRKPNVGRRQQMGNFPLISSPILSPVLVTFATHDSAPGKSHDSSARSLPMRSSETGNSTRPRGQGGQSCELNSLISPASRSSCRASRISAVFQ